MMVALSDPRLVTQIVHSGGTARTGEEVARGRPVTVRARTDKQTRKWRFTFRTLVELQFTKLRLANPAIQISAGSSEPAQPDSSTVTPSRLTSWIWVKNACRSDEIVTQNAKVVTKECQREASIQVPKRVPGGM